jgi:uncharacterized protein (DUF952 family)
MIDFNQVKTLAALHYSPQQIAVMLSIDDAQLTDWMEDKTSEFYKNYWSGYYETDIQLRNAVKKLALAGSSPAQSMLKRYQDDNEAKGFWEG